MEADGETQPSRGSLFRDFLGQVRILTSIQEGILGLTSIKPSLSLF